TEIGSGEMIVALDRLGVIRERLLPLPITLIADGAVHIEPRNRIFRPRQLDRLGVVSDSLGAAALVIEGIAAVIIEAGEVRVPRDNLGPGGGCLIVVAAL